MIDWVEGLTAWEGALVRAAVAAARHVLPLWERACPDDARPSQAIAAAVAAVVDPSPATLQAAQDAASAAERAADELQDGSAGPAEDAAFCADLSAASAARMAAEAAYAVAGAGDPEDVRDAIEQAELVLTTARAAGVTLAVTTRVAIRAELVPWALGMEPLESRMKADDVFGDVTPYKRRRGSNLRR